MEQNVFPVKISFVEIGLDVYKDLDELSLSYSVECDERDKGKKAKYAVVEMQVHDADELKRGLDYAFRYAGYEQRVVISVNCELFHTVTHNWREWSANRIVEIGEEPPSTVIFSDSATLVWGMVTNHQAFMDKSRLDMIMAGAKETGGSI